MAVQTQTLRNGGHSVTSIHARGATSLSSRSFYIPRIKTAAAALLRHGYRLPSHHVTESRHHNSHVIACNLPRDVLRKIFNACAHYSVGEDDGWSWINVSYICSSWRQTALETPELWRYIDFSHPKWYAITAVRAKTSSLHVVATVNESNIRQLYRTLQLAHRIQHVHLVSPVECVTPLLETIAYPNPYLESVILDVRIPDSCSPQQMIYDPPWFPLDGPALKSLKYMELHNAPFYLLTPRCTSLTELRIHDLPLMERPTLRYFLLMLDQLQDLQVLTLDRSFPLEFEDLDGSPTLDAAPINLPKLRCLSLTGSLNEIASSLKFLLVPSSTRLIFKICDLSNVKINAPKLAGSLSSHSWPESDDNMYETMVFTGQEYGQRYTEDFVANPDFRQSFRLRAFNSSEQGGPVVDFTVHPEESSTDDALMATLDVILAGLPIKGVQTLALQDVDIITQKSWTNILRGMPALRVLDIKGRAPSGLAWALLLNAKPLTSSPSKRKPSPNAQRILVPKLNDMYLHAVDCSSGGFMVASSAAVNSHCALDDSRFLDVLVAAITLRQRGGVSLRSLSITRCTFVLKSTVEGARKYVSHLVNDCRGIVKNEGAIDENFPARYEYAAAWGLSPGSTLPQVRHYHRLRTLSPLGTKS